MQRVQVALEFEGVHCWPAASGKYAYLTYPHRHKFRVVVQLEVLHDDREVEFYALRDEVGGFCSGEFYAPTASCEDIARLIYDFLRKKFPGRWVRVGVFEDADFGAWVDGE